MGKLLLGAVIGALAFFVYQRNFDARPSARVEAVGQADALEVEGPDLPAAPAATAAQQYRCDGRTRCSQMTSCAEATFFLQNCPGVEMDGEGDGIPCERQWCGSRR